MSLGLKLSIGLAVYGGLLVTFNQLIPKKDLTVLANVAEVSPSASRNPLQSSPLQSSPLQSSPVAFPAANSTQIPCESFTRMRAALATARLRASELASYTATLEMQEEVNGRLKPLASIQVKLRQQPFSVYMRWDGNGQEALFVHGRNEDRLLAKPPRALAAFKRLWRLDPDSRMAKQGCRHPITASGIENMVNRVHDFYSGREDWSSAVTCDVAESPETGSLFTVYEMEFLNKDVSPLYLKSRLSFDEATGLLLTVENYGWTNDDDSSPRLLEHYAYRAVNSSPGLVDHDFDEKNTKYEFVAR